MSTRDDITAAAVGSMADVHVTPYYRQSLKPGDGFVRMARRERDDSGFGFMDTWEVWIALPENEVDAEKWLDANLAPLIEALSGAMVVLSAAPSQLVLGTSVVNGVIVSGATAA